MKKSLLLAVAGILACGAVASAANKEGQFSLSPVIGGYTFDAGQNLDTTLVYGARAGYNVTNHFGVEALFDYINPDSPNNKKNITMYRYGAELLYHFFPENAFVPYLAAGYAGLNFDVNGFDHRTKGAFDFGGGVKYFLNDNFALRADVRGIMYKLENPFGNYTNSNLEYTVGAYIPFGGVKPAVKLVEPPPAPAPTPAPEVVEPPPIPAPAPPAAPTAALTVSPTTVTKGQSAILNWKSQNTSGCEIQPGIGPVPPQGVRTITPDVSTSYDLACSGAGGTATSAAGVTVMLPPPPAPAPLTPKAVAAAERFCNKPAILNIQFDTNKSDIKPKYEADLKNVGEFLMEFPKARGEISGHTDSTAGNEYNQKLSERRAVSVEKYISTTFGINPGRITTKGYGKTKPIASNKTKAGRAKNRRIEANFTCE